MKRNQKKPKLEEPDSLRRRAEKLLSKKAKANGETGIDSSVKLLHELQVQQIELEMQNEELRKAQAEIEKSRSKYIDLYDFAPVGYFTFDRKGMILEANLASEKLLGVERSLLLHHPFIRFVSQESLTTFHFHLERVFSADAKETCELKLIKKRGDPFYASLESISSRDREGSPVQCRSALSDITKRVRMEEALRESEKKYRNLVEQSLQGTFIIQDMRFVFCNQTFANMGGYTLEELYSLSPEEVMGIIHPDDQERVWGRFREKLEGKPLPPALNELRAFRKDGSIAWVLYDAARIDYRGRPAMLISIVEITKRREAEGALRESEQRYRQLAESARDFIFVVDREGKVRYVNGSGAKEFGCDPNQLLGKPVMELFLPNAAKRQWDPIRNVIQSGRALLNSETKVAFPRREAWLNTSLVPLRAEDGAVNQVLGISRDVTERKLSEEALRESEARYRQLSEENARLLEQAQQDAQTKTTLLHEVNHRVKNNLASIIGLIQTQERFRREKNSPEFWSMCRDLAGRVEGLATVHNLLSAAGWSSVNLADLATEVIQSTLRILPPDQRVSVGVSPSSTRVSADQASTLALVINELATNTIKHGQMENQPFSILVHIEGDEGQVLFEFRDNGPGYPEPIFHQEQYNVGLHLVINLVQKDLRGDVIFCNDHGAVTRVRFERGRS